jgi:N-acetylneuraminate synthase
VLFCLLGDQFMGSTYIIAEAGVNHDGYLDRALKLCEVAAEAGANAVKFRSFKAESMMAAACSPHAHFDEDLHWAETHPEEMKQLELSKEEHAKLAQHCSSLGIHFLSTPFDLDWAKFLVREIGVQRLKVSSSDLTNLPFLVDLARLGCPLILSTGMASLGEVEMALSALAFGFTVQKGDPFSDALQNAYESHSGQESLTQAISLLHCTTEYPAPLQDVNLNCIATLRKAFGLKVGYSDHTEGIAIPIAAAALGAEIIEKHFTLDRTLPGPDHEASLEPDDLKVMVRSIRETEMALGHSIKCPSASEIKMRALARKSLVAKAEIKAGDLFERRNLTTQRPGNGLPPRRFWELLGKPARQDYQAGELIEP